MKAFIKTRIGEPKIKEVGNKGCGILYDKCLQSWFAPTCKNVVSICGFLLFGS